MIGNWLKYLGPEYCEGCLSWDLFHLSSLYNVFSKYSMLIMKFKTVGSNLDEFVCGI